jgi:hypothetical protein
MGERTVNTEIQERKRHRQRHWRRAARLVGALALVASGNAPAWNGCEHERIIEATHDLSGVETLAIDAAAGDLDIRGDAGSSVVTVRGKVCASRAEWVDDADVTFEGGERARLATVLPDASGMSWGNSYVSMDLELTVPASLTLDIRDSSGDIEIREAGSVSVMDSSGDIDLSRVENASVQDSSGDIEIDGVSGDVTIVRDSSGDIRGRDIGGSVIVANDSSGDIRFRDVDGDFLVERDSSGDVVADGIGGDFTVLRDGSGTIRHGNVNGEVRIPDDD